MKDESQKWKKNANYSKRSHLLTESIKCLRTRLHPLQNGLKIENLKRKGEKIKFEMEVYLQVFEIIESDFEISP